MIGDELPILNMYIVNKDRKTLFLNERYKRVPIRGSFFQQPSRELFLEFDKFINKLGVVISLTLFFENKHSLRFTGRYRGDMVIDATITQLGIKKFQIVGTIDGKLIENINTIEAAEMVEEVIRDLVDQENFRLVNKDYDGR